MFKQNNHEVGRMAGRGRSGESGERGKSGKNIKKLHGEKKKDLSARNDAGDAKL